MIVEYSIRRDRKCRLSVVALGCDVWTSDQFRLSECKVHFHVP